MAIVEVLVLKFKMRRIFSLVIASGKCLRFSFNIQFEAKNY